jgi:hypothetical protein
MTDSKIVPFGKYKDEDDIVPRSVPAKEKPGATLRAYLLAVGMLS